VKKLSNDHPVVIIGKRIVSHLLLGLLWVVASLPVVTFGAATTAMLFTAETCDHKGEGKLQTVFWKSFRREFKQATLLSLIAAVMAAGLVLDGYILSTMDISDTLAAILMIYFVWAFCWLQLWFGYLSKFNDTIRVLLANTFRIFFGSFFWVLLLGIIAGAAILGAYAAVNTCPLLLLLIPGVYVFLTSLVLRKLFQKYIPAKQENM